jgi:hypothetical protein
LSRLAETERKGRPFENGAPLDEPELLRGNSLNFCLIGIWVASFVLHQEINYDLEAHMCHFGTV